MRGACLRQGKIAGIQSTRLCISDGVCHHRSPKVEALTNVMVLTIFNLHDNMRRSLGQTSTSSPRKEQTKRLSRQTTILALFAPSSYRIHQLFPAALPRIGGKSTTGAPQRAKLRLAWCSASILLGAKTSLKSFDNINETVKAFGVAIFVWLGENA